MKQSKLSITTIVSLFVIFGLIETIHAQKLQRGTVRFSSNPLPLSPSDEAPSVIEPAERNNKVKSTSLRSDSDSTSQNVKSARRKIVSTTSAYAVAEAQPKSRSRVRTSPIQRKTVELIQNESPRPIRERQQLSSSTRSEVIYQNDLESNPRNEINRREDLRRTRKKSTVSDTNSTTTTEKPVRIRTRQRESKNLEAPKSSPESTITSTTSRIVRKFNKFRASTPTPIKTSTEEPVTTTAKPIAALTRGVFKPKVKPAKQSEEDDTSGENYPEEFKLLLKSKLKDEKSNGATLNNVVKTSSKAFIKPKPRDELFRASTKPPTTSTTTTTESTTTTRTTTAKTTKPRKTFVPTNRNNLGSRRPATTTTLEPVTVINQNENKIDVLRQPGFFRSNSKPSKSAMPSKSTKYGNYKQVVAPTKATRTPATSALNPLIRPSSRFRSENRNVVSSMKKSPNYKPTVPTFSTPSANGWEWSITHPSNVESSSTTHSSYFWPSSSNKNNGIQQNWNFLNGYRDSFSVFEI